MLYEAGLLRNFNRSRRHFAHHPTPTFHGQQGENRRKRNASACIFAVTGMFQHHRAGSESRHTHPPQHSLRTHAPMAYRFPCKIKPKYQDEVLAWLKEVLVCSTHEREHPLALSSHRSPHNTSPTPQHPATPLSLDPSVGTSPPTLVCTWATCLEWATGRCSCRLHSNTTGEREPGEKLVPNSTLSSAYTWSPPLVQGELSQDVAVSNDEVCQRH